MTLLRKIFGLLSLTVVVAISSLAQQPSNDNTKPAAPPTGSITGRVVSSGQPLAGAVVYVMNMGNLGPPPRGSIVDGDGLFKVDGLDPGAYSVWANAPGFISDSPFGATDAPRTYYHTGDSVTLNLIRGGIVTGTVTTANGQPVVTANVHALRIRDADGQPLQSMSQPRERLTDDRGVYRLYGLPPGTYLISAGGSPQYYSGVFSAYDNDVPTYAPASTRDTAMEIVVRGGEETTGVNIQYRGEAGHAISGNLTGSLLTETALTYGATVMLTEVESRLTFATATMSSFNNYSFGFYGVPDGEYELLGKRSIPNGEITASEPRRIKLKGGDIVGIELKMLPLASITGQVIVEPHTDLNCGKRRATLLRETVVGARRRNPKPETKTATNSKDKTEPASDSKPPINSADMYTESVTDAKGEFGLRGLYSGVYRIEPHLAGAGWYVGSLSVGSSSQKTPATQSAESSIARDGIRLKSGERFSNLAITIVEGAGSVNGRVSVAEGPLPPKLRVHLVPAEREQAANVLRFFEAPINSDGTFSLVNLAPGRYWIVTRTVNEKDSGAAPGPIAYDSTMRAQLLREAESAKTEIALKPCQRLVDYDLRYVPTSVSLPKQ